MAHRNARTFRKKPIVVQAEQFKVDQRPLPEGVESVASRSGDPTSWTGYRVETPDGWVSVLDGDWIIIGPVGDHYPCKPDIFAATYDEVPCDAP